MGKVRGNRGESAGKEIGQMKKSDGLEGKKPNRNKLFRWANRGVACVLLRTIQIGSDIYVRTWSEDGEMKQAEFPADQVKKI